jgi:hypothetical protein
MTELLKFELLDSFFSKVQGPGKKPNQTKQKQTILNYSAIF